jgi:hypothetical protein
MAVYGLPLQGPPQIFASAEIGPRTMGPRFNSLAMLPPSMRMRGTAPPDPYLNNPQTTLQSQILSSGTDQKLPDHFKDFGPPKDIYEAMQRIGWVESKNNYKEASKKESSTATGKYQYTHPTWNNYMGYPHAYLAPPEVQDRRMMEDLAHNIKRYKGDVVKAVMTHIYPKWVPYPEYWNAPIPNNNGLTLLEYASRVLGKKTVDNYLRNHVFPKMSTQPPNPYLPNPQG